MKRIAGILIVLALAVVVMGQDYHHGYKRQKADHLIGGEHSSIVWDNIFMWGADSAGPWASEAVFVGEWGGVLLPVFIGSVDTLTSPWIQIGYSTTALDAANRFICYMNPEVFTLRLRIIKSASDDSIAISKGYFQLADDTTLVAHETADSSNIFILDGHYSNDLYYYGAYEDIAVDADSLGRDFILRVQAGGYIRFILENFVIADSCFMDADLWAEN